jgi:WD40 repeat protein
LQPLLVELGTLELELQQWLRSGKLRMYGAGNLINLAIAAKLSLQGWQLVGLKICEVDFQGIDLHGVDVRGSSFDRCQFSAGMGSAVDINLSEDGQLLAVCDTNSRIKIWELATNREVAMLVGHQNWVWHTQFSPDNRYLASGGKDNTVRIWDLETGECLQILRGHQDYVLRVGFALSRNLIVSIGADRAIKVWQWRTGRQLLSWTFADRGWRDAIFHAGRGLLAGCSDRGIRVRHLWTGRVICKIETDRACNLRKLAFSSDGRTIFGVNSLTCEIYSWNLASGELESTLIGHPSEIVAICCNDLNRVVSICMEQIRVWQIDTGRCLRAIEFAQTSGKAAVYRDPLVAAASDNGTVKIWNLETGKCLATASGGTPRVMGLATWGNLVASSTDRGLLQLWDFSSHPQLIWSQTGHPGVGGLAFSPDGRKLASSDGKRQISVWDLQAQKLCHLFTGHTDYVRQIRFLDDRTFLSRSYDTTVRCWDLERDSSQQLDFLKSHWILGMEISSDRQWVAFGTISPQVILWHRTSGEIRSIVPQGKRLSLLAFSPDRQRLVGITVGRYLNCWQLPDVDDCYSYQIDGLDVNVLVFHPTNPDWLFLGRDDGSIDLWDLRERRLISHCRAHRENVSGLAIFSSYQHLLSSSTEGSVRLWEIVGTELRQLHSIDLPQTCQGMQLDRVSGLTRSQLVTLQQLGATYSSSADGDRLDTDTDG